MTTTKIIIAIVAVAALALTAVGVAAAQVAQNQYYTNTAPNTQTPNNGFWGWIGNCFGYNAQDQYVAPPTQVNETAPAPYQGGYSYGYSPCWAWR